MWSTRTVATFSLVSSSWRWPALAAVAHGRDGYCLRTGHEVDDGNGLVDRVSDIDVSRAETDRRDPGLDDQRRAVMPVLEPSQLARPADCACRTERSGDDRIVERDLGRRHAADQPFDARRMRGEPGVGGRGSQDPVGELPLDERAPAVL